MRSSRRQARLLLTLPYIHGRPRRPRLARAVPIAGRVALAGVLILAGAGGARAQQWTAQATGSRASLRGLSVVNPQVVWASGTGGTWLLTTDGGAHWQAGQVPGAARLDFRDVKAFSAQTAYLMAIDKDGGIFKTTDGGAHWSWQYSNPDPEAPFFLDCLGFWDATHGLAVGDPDAGGHLLLLRTLDGGAHWTPLAHPPQALPGEGVFAASGTSLAMRGSREAWFATGGTSGARVFHTRDQGDTWTVVKVPAMSPATPSAGAGIFSLIFPDGSHGVAVGGDYTKPAATAGNIALSRDGGRVWAAPPGAPPAGYRSGVARIPGTSTLVAVGTSGSDVSRDGGQSWTPLGAEGFNAVAAARGGWVFAAGGRGRVASLCLDCKR